MISISQFMYSGIEMLYFLVLGAYCFFLSVQQFAYSGIKMLNFLGLGAYAFSFLYKKKKRQKVKEKNQPKDLLKEEKPICSFRNQVKECFCNRFHAAVGIGSTAKRDVFCRALFDQVLNPCDQQRDRCRVQMAMP